MEMFPVHPDDIKRLGLGEEFVLNKQSFKFQKTKLREGLI